MQEDTTFTLPATTDLRRGWGTMDALLLFVAFLWGTNYIALKWAMAGLSPIVVTSLRFVIAAPILWYIVRHRSQGERLAKKDWPLLLFTSTLFAAAQIGYIAGLNLTTATNGALLSATMPIFVAILAPFTGAEGLGRRGWIGISLSIAGIVLVIGRPEGGAFLGDLTILLSSAGWGVYMLMLRPLLARSSTFIVTAYSLGLAGLLQIFIAIPSILQTQWLDTTFLIWFGLFFSGALALGVGNILWNRGISAIGPSRTVMYTSLTPMIAAGASWLLLGERLSLIQCLGAVLTLVGVYVVQSERFR